MRVLVPFGNKKIVGIIVEVADEFRICRRTSCARRTASCATCRRSRREWLELVQFCSGYYHRPLGEVIHGALPPRPAQRKATARARARYALTARPAARERWRNCPRAPRATRAARSPRGEHRNAIGTRRLGAETRARRARELLGAGWIREHRLPRAGEPAVSSTTPAQRRTAQVLSQIECAGAGFGVFLLYGITGSGKTEIYLRLIAAHARRRQTGAGAGAGDRAHAAPRISAFRERFPDARWSVCTAGCRTASARAACCEAQAGDADIVLGTRLAVFVPLPRLGLIVVDEEQDASFKQQDGLRYSARDVGDPPRAPGGRADGARLGHAVAGNLARTPCPAATGCCGCRARRAAGATCRWCTCRHCASTSRDDGLAAAGAEAIAERLARGEQSLVFLNRRGYAPVLAVPDLRLGERLPALLDPHGACIWPTGSCAAIIAARRAPIPRPARTAAMLDLHPFGRGTQRLEATLAARFPQARILRIDRDSARNTGSFERMFGRYRGGRRRHPGRHADPGQRTRLRALTLVGVLNADSALYSADYRAPERLFAQLVQVAGRAGRADLPGEVLIQTHYPRPSAVPGAGAARLRGLRAHAARRARAGRFPAVRVRSRAARRSRGTRDRARVSCARRPRSRARAPAASRSTTRCR